MLGHAVIPALSKVAISAQDRGRSADQREGQGGTRALAQPEVEVDEGTQPEPFERGGMAGLDAAVPGEAVGDRVGGQSLGDEGGRTRDHPVEYDRHPRRRAPEDQPDDPRVLEPAHLGQDVDGS